MLHCLLGTLACRAFLGCRAREGGDGDGLSPVPALTPRLVAPEHATGLLVGRAGLRLAAAPGAVAKAPVAGLVALVTAEPEGAAVVLDAGAGWTVIVSGLAAPGVAAGARVAAGEPLGRVADGAGGVGFEIWRGRHPVDPLLLVRAAPPARPAPPGPEPLAAPPPVP
jgi:hypothetical protein